MCTEPMAGTDTVVITASPVRQCLAAGLRAAFRAVVDQPITDLSPARVAMNLLHLGGGGP
jgi:hypothetical protein